MAKTCDFKTSEASTKAWMRKRNLLTKFLEIPESKLTHFRQQNSYWSKKAFQRHHQAGIKPGDMLFYEEPGAKKVIPNTEMFRRIDADKGNFYQENLKYANDIKTTSNLNTEVSGFNISIENNIENTVTETLKEKVFTIGEIPFEKTEFENLNVYVKKKNDNEFSIAVDNKGRNIFGLVSAVLDFQRRDLDNNSIYVPNPKGFILWENFLKSDVASAPKAKVIVDNRFSIALGTLKALRNNGIEFVNFPENFTEDFKNEYSQFLKQEFSSVGYTDPTENRRIRTIQISVDDLTRIINLKNTKQDVDSTSKQLSDKFVDDLYNLNITPEVITYLYNENGSTSKLEDYAFILRDLVNNLKSQGFTNQQILEDIKCL